MVKPEPAPLPPIVSLLGFSGSGKTTTAVALLERWSARGLRVAYVKHASHGFEMDRSGKDTDRATRAGAWSVAVTGPEGLALLEPRPEEDPRRIVRRFFPDADVVVVEGFRDAALPAVVLVGADDAGGPKPAPTADLVAVVAAEGSPAREEARARGTPAFAAGDVDALARHLEGRLGIPSTTAGPPRRLG